MKSKILKTIHKTAHGLYKAKAINDITMKEFDTLCFAPVHSLKPIEIKRLRTKIVHVSQPVFAAILNVSASTIKKWETGEKKPSGSALKLLNIIQRKGAEVLF